MKKYIKPNMRVVEVKTVDILAASTLGVSYDYADPNEAVN